MPVNVMIIQMGISLGILWSLMTIGVYMSYRILEMPDLSVEGTIILGAAVAARMISQGQNPFLATLLAMLVGCVGGLVTGLLHTKLKIPPILAGILTMVASYSVVLRIMGASNVGLPPHGPVRVISVYTFLQEMGLTRQNAIILLSSAVVLAVCMLLFWFFGTEIGCAVRATGNNRQMVKAQGVNTDVMIILCLMISNGFVGLGGALVAQAQGFADVGMGIGTIVAGLASVIIAEVIFRVRRFGARLISLVAGMIIYRLIIAFVLDLGMNPNDLRLFKAITVAVALTLPLIHGKASKITRKIIGRRA